MVRETLVSFSTVFSVNHSVEPQSYHHKRGDDTSMNLRATLVWHRKALVWIPVTSLRPAVCKTHSEWPGDSCCCFWCFTHQATTRNRVRDGRSLFGLWVWSRRESDEPHEGWWVVCFFALRRVISIIDIAMGGLHWCSRCCDDDDWTSVVTHIAMTVAYRQCRHRNVALLCCCVVGSEGDVMGIWSSWTLKPSRCTWQCDAMWRYWK
jgi:hypothetical protein